MPFIGLGRNSTSNKERWTSRPRSWPQALWKVRCGIVYCNYASGSRSWSVFCRLMSSDKFCLRRNTSPKEMSWALIDFAAWCIESKGNLASTISGKIAAVQ